MKTLLYLALLFAGLSCSGRHDASPARAARALMPDMEALPEEFMIYCPVRRRVLYPGEDEPQPRLRLLLSRERFWAEDGHLDVMVRLDVPKVSAEDRVIYRMLDDEGRELMRAELGPLPGPRFVFYPRLPEVLVDGGRGEIELTWEDASGTRARERRGFRVERTPDPAPRAGRVALEVANSEGVTARQFPFTVGVPFPRGALGDAAHLRLLDEQGHEIPLQVRATGRWSRYGSLKWVLCDFTLDLAGAPRRLELEYGPEVRRAEGVPLAVEETSGFPRIEAGRLRVDGGLWYDRDGSGDYVQVLGEEAMNGAFVARPDGRRYRMPLQDRYEVEEQGPHKVVIRREGWYREENGDGRFCRYITRYSLHRDSPLLRIVHTWIYTGDGNREPVANMGWRFPLAEGFAGEGFLDSFGEDGAWQPGMRLLQYDYEQYDLEDEHGIRAVPGGRAAGVAAAAGQGVRLVFGARDFWQNYPSELEFHDGAFWFHNWPRRNRPAGYTFEGELSTASGEPALPSAARHAQYREGRLTSSEWRLNLIQARFAHEGENLNFRLPDALAEDPIWTEHCMGRPPRSYCDKGAPETANAQGIARTEELWLYLTPAETGGREAAAVLRGLNAETLRAVADPLWVAASGAFDEVHHRDVEKYPEDERVFDLLARFPGQIIERLGLYGMWIFGDIAAYNPRLAQREPRLYRAYRKGHQGWPYSWLPYARSGDPDLLRLAAAATLQMIDANYCHYVSAEVQATTPRPRRIGRWQRSPLPWAARGNPTSRCYESHSDYLWHAYYLTGYRRAREQALNWGELTKTEEDLYLRGPICHGAEPFRSTDFRYSLTLLKSYLDMYQATFDPWFMVAAHALAEGHLDHYHERGGTGHIWRPGDRDYLRYTGREDYVEYYLAYADRWGRHNAQAGWALSGTPCIEPTAHAWRLTGNEYYLRRVASYLDWARVAVLDSGEPEYFLGDIARGGVTRYHGWYYQQFPLALAAFEAAGRRPEPIYSSFIQQVVRAGTMPDGRPRFTAPAVFLRKQEGQPLPLSFAGLINPGSGPADETYDYRVTGPDGTLVLSGSWRLRNRYELTLPAAAPAGQYRLDVEGTYAYPRGYGGLEVPVSPVGAPEVIAWPPGQPAAPRAGGEAGNREVQYWFLVPEGLSSFSVRVVQADRRVSIWDPDGERVWDRQGSGSLEPDIPVQPQQAGRLWRITLPGGGAFTLDARIPPVLAVNPERWFMPEWPDEQPAGRAEP